jgi:hypothetical protein
MGQGPQSLVGCEGQGLRASPLFDEGVFRRVVYSMSFGSVKLQIFHKGQKQVFPFKAVSIMRVWMRRISSIRGFFPVSISRQAGRQRPIPPSNLIQRRYRLTSYKRKAQAMMRIDPSLIRIFSRRRLSALVTWTFAMSWLWEIHLTMLKPLRN